jgi:predicted lactoylglutathione lyase
MTSQSDVAATRALGLVALVGVATFTVACGAVQFLRGDYNWMRVPLSFYVIGRGGRMVETSYFVLACGLVAYGIGGYRALARNARSAAPMLLFVLAAIALCVTAAEFTDVPGRPPTLHGVVHVVAANATFLCITVAMLLQSWRWRRDPYWRGRFRPALTLAAIAFAALWIHALVKPIPRGLGEKVVVALILLWLWRASWWLLRGSARRALRQGNGTTPPTPDMPDPQTPAPGSAAVRTAMWRALHVLGDPLPYLTTTTHRSKTMPRQIFINLPVQDLARATTFYSAVGAVRNPHFSDDTAACMVISDTIFVMLLTHAKWATFTQKPIVDGRRESEVMLALSCESRAAVDKLIEAAGAAGGKADVNPKQDLGFMYGRSFEDVDGHIWETFHMDMSQIPGGQA